MTVQSLMRTAFHARRPIAILIGLVLPSLIESHAIAKSPYQRILFLGNSITLHGPNPAIGWTSNWGMAASAQEKDFVHRVARALTPSTGPAPAIMVKNIATFERGFATYDVGSKLADVLAFRADLVVLAIGENVPKLETEQVRTQFADALKKLLQALKAAGGPRIVIRSCFWANPIKDQILKRACQDAGGTFVDIGGLGKDKANYARSERQFSHAGVGGHPGDRGMQAIADAILAAVDRPPQP